MILVDSNIIIYHLNNLALATQFLHQNRGKMYISTITVAEILSFAPNVQILNMTQRFLQENFVWLDVSREIIFKTAEIRRQRKIKTPDALIAATALVHGLVLASRNDKDFKNMGIAYINPID